MNRLWSPGVRELTPYTPGEQPRIANLIKMNTNENPYGPSPKVLAAIHAETGDALRLYPDPECSHLKEAVARYHGLTPDQVFAGNGSDEVLAHAFNAFFVQDLPILFPDITYNFYTSYCRLYGIDYETIPLDADMKIRLADYRRPCGGIVIANPNAPTGCHQPLSEIEALLRANPDCVVLVDEAYVDFGADSAIPLVPHYPNLLVVHTLSKSRSLAGLRVGFAAGQASLIEALERVKNSFNAYPLDKLSIAGAVAAMDDDAYFQETRHKVMQSRERLAAQLRELGFEVCPSTTNFLFARHPRHDALALAAALRARAILVRHFRQPRIDQYLRISIGSDAECDALHAALAELTGV